MSSFHSTPPLHPLSAGLAGGGMLLILGLLGGLIAARLMRSRHLHWAWGAAALAPGVVLWSAVGWRAIIVPAAAANATRLGRRWHRHDLTSGGDLAQVAAMRFAPGDGLRVLHGRWLVSRERWFSRDGLLLGHDRKGAPGRIPVGLAHSGAHTLVVGATGSGKTVTQAWIAVRCIEQGMAAVVVDPKGDDMFAGELRLAAQRCGRRFVTWTPEGPAVYNPFARGANSEVADKALAAERFTEPHYLRQAQRYLNQEVGVLRGADVPVSLAALVAHLDPTKLEVLARRLPEELAGTTFDYLDSLTARQVRDLAGIRDRLAVLAESDVGRWLDPAGQTPGSVALDLLEAVKERAVVYFRLDADRRPLLAQMLGAAIVQDLLTMVAALQHDPVPALVVMDEFSALGTENVSRLFGRARSAKVSLLLGTQELSDLRPNGNDTLLDQVLGNLSTLVAHRQVVPASADLVAAVAGTRGGWVMARRSGGGGTSTRTRQFRLHPQDIRGQGLGCAAVIVTSSREEPRLIRVLSPTNHR